MPLRIHEIRQVLCDPIVTVYEGDTPAEHDAMMAKEIAAQRWCDDHPAPADDDREAA